MNFVDNLNTASTDWAVGDVIRSTIKNYLIAYSEGSSPTTYFLIDVSTMKVYLTATSLSALKSTFTGAGQTISKVIPASQLTLTADE